MYTTREQVAEVIESSILTKVLDRGEDSDPDVVFASMLRVVDLEIDGYFGARYRLPLTTIPPIIAHAAVVFFCELAYKREGIPADQNPWNWLAKDIRSRLQRIADGLESMPGAEIAVVTAAIERPTLKFSS